MAISSLTASQALLNLVLDANQCTDYRAAQLLGVGCAAVSKWRVGRAHMSNATIEKACELARCPELAWYFVILISGEREKGPDGDCFRTAAAAIKRELEGQPREKTTEKVVHALAARALKRKAGAASIVIMGLFCGFASPNKALASRPASGGNATNGALCELKRRRKKAG